MISIPQDKTMLANNLLSIILKGKKESIQENI